MPSINNHARIRHLSEDGYHFQVLEVKSGREWRMMALEHVPQHVIKDENASGWASKFRHTLVRGRPNQAGLYPLERGSWTLRLGPVRLHMHRCEVHVAFVKTQDMAGPLWEPVWSKYRSCPHCCDEATRSKGWATAIVDFYRGLRSGGRIWRSMIRDMR